MQLGFIMWVNHLTNVNSFHISVIIKLCWNHVLTSEAPFQNIRNGHWLKEPPTTVAWPEDQSSCSTQLWKHSNCNTFIRLGITVIKLWSGDNKCTAYPQFNTTIEWPNEQAASSQRNTTEYNSWLANLRILGTIFNAIWCKSMECGLGL